MDVRDFVRIIGADFYTGVPDSQLRALCDHLMDAYGIDPHHHIIAANEGNATAIAAGYHLATGKAAVVYMQNSGEGNTINPIASLLAGDVYAIPCIFVIGWRGEPGVHDEPQHIYQGRVTCQLLEDMGIGYEIISADTGINELGIVMERFKERLAQGHSVAFVIRKDALIYDGHIRYQNDDGLIREQVIQHITAVSGDDPVISTTGKASRELFETREKCGLPHSTDFLTVGSMGHCSSIALGVALNTEKTVWCIDGDGAVLMHLGALPIIAHHCPQNLIHIVINNGAHETVGGQPTVAGGICLSDVARACGYPYAVTVADEQSLDRELGAAKYRGELSFIEVKCRIGSRKDLGRPTITTLENKERFMKYLALK